MPRRAVAHDVAGSRGAKWRALTQKEEGGIRDDTLPLVLEVARGPRYSVSTCYSFHHSTAVVPQRRGMSFRPTTDHCRVCIEQQPLIGTARFVAIAMSR